MATDSNSTQSGASSNPGGDSSDPTSTDTAAVHDDTGCQVVEIVASSSSSGGPTTYTRRLSDPDLDHTSAYIDATPSGIFTVTCLAGTETRLRLSFGPYKGDGDYDLAVGALEIEGQRSDRPCKVSMSKNFATGALRGFLSCPTEPYSESNVFARSGVPTGLGAFDATPR